MSCKKPTKLFSTPKVVWLVFSRNHLLPPLLHILFILVIFWACCRKKPHQTTLGIGNSSTALFPLELLPPPVLCLIIFSFVIFNLLLQKRNMLSFSLRQGITQWIIFLPPSSSSSFYLSSSSPSSSSSSSYKATATKKKPIKLLLTLRVARGGLLSHNFPPPFLYLPNLLVLFLFLNF